jgi:arylsulfatase A-like enzyme
MKSRLTTIVPWVASFLLLGLIAVTSSAAGPAKPNILFIVADDMGFSDAGCYGGEIQTPNLDRLAAAGLRFTQFYNTARCWPSRACVMTGYYAQSVRRDGETGFSLPPEYGRNGSSGVRPCWAQMLPEHLKPMGYRSYVSGKWHLDGQPLANGFDHAYISANNDGFFSAKGHSEDGVGLPAGKVDGSYNSTVAIADHAIKYLKEHAAKHPDRPFFQYLTFHSPHFPIQALPEDIAIYKDRYQAGWDALRVERLARMKKLGIVDCDLSKLEAETVPSWNLKEDALKKRVGPGEVGRAVPWDSLTAEEKRFQSAKMSVHAAMVNRMDIEIGRVLGQIHDMGVADNTAVFFVSDNGASAEQIIRGLGEDPNAPIGSAMSYLGIGPGWSSAANTPFRLHKSWNHEGGIATPMIVAWPGGIKASGELRTDPAHLIDLVPTVLDITGGTRPATVAGLPVPPLPGLSLVPDFGQDGRVKHDWLWWNHDGNRAFRAGDWKLVADHGKPWELFDLRTDRAETRNLAAEHPEKVKEMDAAWTKHAAEFHALALQDPPPAKAGAKGKAKPEPAD